MEECKCEIMKRCTKAIIHKDNLIHNLNEIKKLVSPKTKVCIVVKADAYGHSSVFVATLAETMGFEYLAVATVDEAIELRQAGIKSNIILLSLCTPEEMMAIFEYHIIPLIFSDKYIDLLIHETEIYNQKKNTKEKVDVFLAVDTGMGRIGCSYSESGLQAKKIESSKYLFLKGMCTHFAVSDCIEENDEEYTNLQFDKFKHAIELVRKEGIDPGICSCGSSAVTLNNFEMHLDMIRPGLIIYGYYPNDVTKDYLEKKGRFIDLKPVLSLETKIVAIKHFSKGDSISYGRTFVCEEETDIAILPIGYADGLNRLLSCGGKVSINGHSYPICGRICMDQCMVNLGNNNCDVHLWDKVVIFGPENSGALQDANDLAKICNTISYEILTSLSKRVERIIL